MFSDVVYYHCSEFQIFRPLNGSHFLVLSLYPHSVQNQAWFCLHFSDHGKPKQTDVIFSRFVSLSLVNHGRLPLKNLPIAGFSPLLSRSGSPSKCGIEEADQSRSQSRLCPFPLRLHRTEQQVQPGRKRCLMPWVRGWRPIDPGDSHSYLEYLDFDWPRDIQIRTDLIGL